MNNLQDVLTNKRKDLGLSLRGAAKLIGISHSYLGSLEKGVGTRNNAPVKASLETLLLISKAYHISNLQLLILSGYLEDKIVCQPKFIKKDEKDIEKITLYLEKYLWNNLMDLALHGEPISQDTLECFSDALNYGINQAKKMNK